MLAGAFARDGMAGVDENHPPGQRSARRSRCRRARASPSASTWRICSRANESSTRRATSISRSSAASRPNAEAVSRLGILAVSMGMPRFAVKLMKQAAALRPDVLAYHNNLAEAQLAVGQLPEAEASFRTALRMAPNDAEIVCKLAQVVARLGRKEEAIAALRAAVTAGLNAAMVHATLGALLGEVGRQEEARAAYQAALTRDPRFAPAVQGLQRLVPSPGTHGDG